MSSHLNYIVESQINSNIKLNLNYRAWPQNTLTQKEWRERFDRWIEVGKIQEIDRENLWGELEIIGKRKVSL